MGEKKIFILDSNQSLLELWGDIARGEGYSVFTPNNPFEMQSQLEESLVKEESSFYFVDIDHENNEMTSKEFYNSLESKGKNLNNFYFMVSSSSNYDEEFLNKFDHEYFFKSSGGLKIFCKNLSINYKKVKDKLEEKC